MSESLGNPTPTTASDASPVTFAFGAHDDGGARVDARAGHEHVGHEHVGHDHAGHDDHDGHDHVALGAEPRYSQDDAVDVALRDIADVPAVEIISSSAVHLMSAAAVKCGLAEDTPTQRAADLVDLDEARKLITALAALVTAAAPDIGDQHARPLRDGLRSLQLAFREASPAPDAPGAGPGEKFTGPVR